MNQSDTITSETQSDLSGIEPTDALAATVDEAANDTLARETSFVAVQPLTIAEKDTVVIVPPAWEDGMEALPRTQTVGGNSWLTALILLMLALVAFNIHSLRQIVKTFPQDIFGGSRRNRNAFETHTDNEHRTAALTLGLLFVFEGIIMLRASINSGKIADGSSEIFVSTLIFIGLALAYYVGKLGLYMLAGFTFADDSDIAQWRRGYNATQMLLCLLIALPAILALFYPGASKAMIIIAIVFFFICQGLFVVKTFRIFFNNYSSSLYFILYLCALEITPVFIAAGAYSSLS